MTDNKEVEIRLNHHVKREYIKRQLDALNELVRQHNGDLPGHNTRATFTQVAFRYSVPAKDADAFVKAVKALDEDDALDLDVATVDVLDDERKQYAIMTRYVVNRKTVVRLRAGKTWDDVDENGKAVVFDRGGNEGTVSVFFKGGQSGDDWTQVEVISDDIVDTVSDDVAKAVEENCTRFIDVYEEHDEEYYDDHAPTQIVRGSTY